jgi:multiple sugar transport system permease protein
MPFLWMISLAFQNPTEAFAWPPNPFPQNPTLENFAYVLTETILPTAFLNSAIVSLVSVVTNLGLASLAGYAFARLYFPGRDILFFVLIATTMIPAAVSLIPLFLMTKGFPLAGGNDLFGQGGIGLLDSLPGLILPHVVGALNIFLSRQFFLELPDELAEAARIDGAREFSIFWRVYLPLAQPLIATIAIFSFTGAWEDFLWPLVVTSSTDKYTVQITLNSFQSGGNIQWGYLMASAVLATLPLFLVFLFFQKYFVEGLASGSVKG